MGRIPDPRQPAPGSQPGMERARAAAAPRLSTSSLARTFETLHADCVLTDHQLAGNGPLLAPVAGWLSTSRSRRQPAQRPVARRRGRERHHVCVASPWARCSRPQAPISCPAVQHDEELAALISAAVREQLLHEVQTRAELEEVPEWLRQPRWPPGAARYPGCPATRAAYPSASASWTPEELQGHSSVTWPRAICN
jgi:hypothetical protein